jgi:hypothetical protein
MPIPNAENDSPEASNTEIEVILQRIFHENDPVAHRAAIWELIGPTDDWDMFEKIQDLGAQKSIEGYFRSLLENFNLAVEDVDFEADDQRDQLQDMYAAPLMCVHEGDVAGLAASMHEILLYEIYTLYSITEADLPFGEATALGLKKWVGEEILFPLSILEYMAFSDYLTDLAEAGLKENNLALMLTLFFSAQAYLDMQEGEGDDGLKIIPSGDDD